MVSSGNITDHRATNIFGFNTEVGTEYIPLWENATAYTYPQSALTMTAVSDSASDTAVTMLIQGLDINHDEIQTTFTLNGTNAVTIDTAFYRINTVVTISGNAVGTVTIANAGTTYAKVRAGDGKNQAAIFTVPRGHSFYLYRIDAFSGQADATANRYVFFRNESRSGTGVELRVAETTFRANMHIQRRFPFRYAEKTDIQYQCKSSAGTHEIGVFAEGVLIKDGT
jgi:Flp pilus assembly protein TadG